MSNAGNMRHEELLSEYSKIIDEIMQKIELRNTLLICVYTASVAVLGFSLGNDGEDETAALALLPILMVIPLSFRVGYYRDAIAKLSAYLIEFIEPKFPEVNWETRNDCALRLHTLKSNNDFVRLVQRLLNSARYIDFPIICVICIGVFVYKGGLSQPHGCALLLAASALTFFEFILIIYFNSILKNRDSWRDTWIRVKIAEAARTRFASRHMP